MCDNDIIMCKTFKVLYFKRYNGFGSLFPGNSNDDLLDEDDDFGLKHHFAGRLLMPREDAELLAEFLKEQRQTLQAQHRIPINLTFTDSFQKRVNLLRRNCVFLCGHSEVATELEQLVRDKVFYGNRALRGAHTANNVKYEFFLEVRKTFHDTENFGSLCRGNRTSFKIWDARFYGLH